jgi:hypothetical protein
MPPDAKLPIVVIACRVFESLFNEHLPPDLAARVSYLDYGLHSVPKRLTKSLQDAVDSVQTPSLILIGYGLCGNGLNGIKAGPHTLLVSRVDDCIAILFGSCAAFRKEFDAVPGTYYLTKGWLESGSNPLGEYNKYVEKYGQSTADYVMNTQYRHYTRLVFIAHSQADLDGYRTRAQEVAAFCAERFGMRYQEILGSDRYVRRLIEVAASLADGVTPGDVGSDFVVVPPGGELRQADFVR